MIKEKEISLKCEYCKKYFTLNQIKVHSDKNGQFVRCPNCKHPKSI